MLDTLPLGKYVGYIAIRQVCWKRCLYISLLDVLLHTKPMTSVQHTNAVTPVQHTNAVTSVQHTNAVTSSPT